MRSPEGFGRLLMHQMESKDSEVETHISSLSLKELELFSTACATIVTKCLADVKRREAEINRIREGKVSA